ncbi:hypothetical protein D3C85_1367360 [compost metagenome]
MLIHALAADSGAAMLDALRWLLMANSVMAMAATAPGKAKAMKLSCNGRLTPSNAPPSSGPTMAPLRPMPEAQPRPVERMAME